MNNTDEGFTIIEALVAIIVAFVFILAIYLISSTITVFAVNTNHTYRADALAYRNLRTYANGRSPTWFTCPSTQTDPVQLYSSTSAVSGLPGPVQQTVVADAPYGCSGSSAGSPIRVTSTVTYGPNNAESRSTTYASY